MLIFMTYNVRLIRYLEVESFADVEPHKAYLIGSVVIGAATGHFLFGATMDVDAVLNGVDGMGRPIACH